MPVDDVRSRTGCKTCRQRKKKCGEEWNEAGACARCSVGNLECVRVVYQGPKRVRTRPPPKTQPKVLPPPSSELVRTPVPLRPAPPRSPTPSEAPVASTSAIPYSSDLATSEYAADFDPVPLLASPPHFDATLFALPTPQHLDALPVGVPPPLPAIISLHDAGMALWMGMGVEDESGLWGVSEEQYSRFIPPETPVDTRLQPVQYEKDEEIEEIGSFVPRGLTVDVLKDAPALYSHFNIGLLRSVLQPIRDLVVQQMSEAAYSFELGRAAMSAVVLLNCARAQKINDPAANGRLLSQSNAYFLQAVTLLGEERIPLEPQLNALLDLWYHQLDHQGATAGYAIFLVGELFVTQALGPRPRLDFSTLEAHNQCLRVIAFTDVMRTICLGNRKTLFDLAGQPGDHRTNSERGRHEGTTSGACSTFLGLHVDLLLCFAASSNLSVDMATLALEEVRTKALIIENAIRAWRAAPPDAETLRDNSFAATTATQEMWRNAALIHLYQSVHRVGCLSQVLQNCLRQILSIGSIAFSEPSTSMNVASGGVHCAPWFLAATCAIAPADRVTCKIGLQRCGSAQVYVDNVAAAELLWAAMDTAGAVPDWRELLHKEGKLVAFF